MALSSCGLQEERADLVFVNSAEIETVDPAFITDQASMRVGESLFEGLCRLNAQGLPEPGVAERWEVSEDKKTYRFYLRKNALWSNGQRVTAKDFVDSWERVLHPDTGADYAPMLYPIIGARDYNEGKLKDFTQVGVKAVSEDVLETHLADPVPYWIDLCAFITLAPVHIPSLKEHGDQWLKLDKLVSNGAYRLKSWKIDDKIRMEVNPSYWDETGVKMKTVDVMPISESNTALNYFLTGQVDLMMDKGMVPPALVNELIKQDFFHTGPFLGSWFIRLNVTKKPLDNPLVRQALHLAIDRSRIVEKITRLGERKAYSLVPPGTGQGYEPPAHDVFNPKKARELLAQAGYPEGKGFPRLEYLYLPIPVEKNIAVELQSMWKEHLGIEIGLNKQEQKVWLISMRELSYDMCRSSWVGDYNDPNTFLEMFTKGNGNNRTGWNHPQYDEKIQMAATQADLTQRYQTMNQAEKLLMQESPIIPVYHYVGVQFYREGLKGVQANLVDMHPFRAMYWEEK